jgi:hypothetical protein
MGHVAGLTACWELPRCLVLPSRFGDRQREHYPRGNRLFAVASSNLACAYEEIGNGK